MSANAFQPRKQSAPVLRTLSILFYGVPKVGKTTEAAKFPGAVLLNCEPSGTDLLKGDHEIADVASLGALEAMLPAICNSSYKTIVLDGFTWLINQGARDEVKRMGERNRLRAYAVITEQVQRILGEILRSGKIVVATGHSRLVDVDEEGEGKVEVRPDINPRLSDGVFGLFSIIAYCYPTKDGSRILTKPEDNDKRRILAGDRSGVLPKTMELSAEKLMALLRQTQPQKGHGEQSKPAEALKNGNSTSVDKPSAPAKAGGEQVKQIETLLQRLYGEQWFSQVAKLAQDASGGAVSELSELTVKEAEDLLHTLNQQEADPTLWEQNA